MRTGSSFARVIPLVLAGLGCAPQQHQLRFDGLVLQVAPDPLTRLTSYDAATLFHLAMEEDRGGRPGYAIRIYERLLAEMPESRYAPAARFNIGLLHEAVERWQAAAERYAELASGPAPESSSPRDIWVTAHFRLAVCAGELGDWWRAVRTLEYLVRESWLDDRQRLEALVGRGIALHEAGDLEGAEVALAAGLRHFREAALRGPLGDAKLAAEAAYRMGEIVRGRYEDLALSGAPDDLRARLEEKCELLLRAQSRYLRAIRLGDAHAAAAAGLRLGGLYETLYREVVGLGVPPGLDEAQAALYEQELLDRVGVLLEKALLAYERSLDVGRRAPTAAGWVERLKEAVRRLQLLVLADNTLSRLTIGKRSESR